jgi:hypothetical protein
MYEFGFTLTRRRFVAFLSVVLLLFSGGLGWLMILKEAPAHEKGILNFFFHLPHDYTSYQEDLRWTNPYIFWFMTMRSMILGVPLAIAVLIYWIRAAVIPASKHPLLLMVGAGSITGFFPLTHSHSYLVLAIMAVILSLFFRNWRLWGVYILILTMMGLPQILWLKSGSLTDPSTFFGFINGWNPNSPIGIGRYWFYNTGIFIPLTVAGLFLLKSLSGKIKLFVLLFHVCFIVPNIVKVAPWEWDNVKILAYWYIAAIPVVALVLCRAWSLNTMGKFFASFLIFTLTFSGALDIWRASSNQNVIMVFDKTLTTTAEKIKEYTNPRSIILTAPFHNNSVLLTGRQSFMGYPGRLWTHGLPYAEREEMVRKIYTASPEAAALIQQENIDYIVVGDQERMWAQEQKIELNEEFFTRFMLIAQAQNTNIYKTSLQ